MMNLTWLRDTKIISSQGIVRGDTNLYLFDWCSGNVREDRNTCVSGSSFIDSVFRLIRIINSLGSPSDLQNPKSLGVLLVQICNLEEISSDFLIVRSYALVVSKE